MKGVFSYKWGIIFFTLIILMIPSIKVKAQSFVVTPTMIELTLFPGEEKNILLRVINLSLQEQSFKVYLRDLILEKEGNINFPPSGSSRWSCASWMRIQPSNFTLAPQHGIEVACKLSVPRGETGGRYAAVIVEPTQKLLQIRDRITPKVRYRIATLVLLTIGGGKLEEKVEISKIKVAPSGKKGEEVVVTLKNEGNVHLIAQGKLIVKDSNGRRWTEVTLKAGRGIILPQNERNFKGTLGRSLPPGEYNLEVAVKYRRIDRWRKFLVKGETSYVVKKTPVSPFEKLPVRFSLKPSSLNVTLPPGARRFFIVEVLSKEEVPIKVKTLVKDAMLSSEKIISKQLENLPQSCREWIETEPKEFYLQPNQKGKLKLFITVPEQVQGKYCAELIVQASFLSPKGEEIEGIAKANISLSIKKR